MKWKEVGGGVIKWIGKILSLWNGGFRVGSEFTVGRVNCWENSWGKRRISVDD